MARQLIIGAGTGSGAVRTTIAGNKAVLHGEFFRGFAPQASFSHDELLNGLARFDVVQGETYAVVISAIFAGKDEVKLVCEVNGITKHITLNGDDDPPGRDHEIGHFQIHA